MNLNYAFWVDYNSDLYGTPAPGASAARNRTITGSLWSEGAELIPFQDQSFCMKVLYPGLLTGIGSRHESGRSTPESPEISLGFAFDYVTGLPCISGSTVKGILRSPFLQNEEYVQELLSTVTGEKHSLDDIHELENQAFGRRHPADRRGLYFEYESGSDVFLDAWPVRPPADGRLLTLENIAHQRARNPRFEDLVSPALLTLLKVAPETVFQFRFLLKDTELASGKTVSAGAKLDLYQLILADLGAGSRTSVGYGALEKTENLTGCCWLTAAEGPEEPDPPPRQRQEKSASRNRNGAKPKNSPCRAPGKKKRR